MVGEKVLSNHKNIFFIWMKSCQDSLLSLCSYFYQKAQGRLCNKPQELGECKAELRPGQPCPKTTTSQTAACRGKCMLQDTGLRDGTTLLREASSPPSRPADIQTRHQGPSPGLCICARVEQKGLCGNLAGCS